MKKSIPVTLFLVANALHLVTKGVSALTTIGAIASLFLSPYALFKMLKSTEKIYNILSIIIYSVSWAALTIFMIMVDKYHNRKKYLFSILVSIPLALFLPGLFIILITPFTSANKKIGQACINISDKYSSKIKKMLDLDDINDNIDSM